MLLLHEGKMFSFYKGHYVAGSVKISIHQACANQSFRMGVTIQWTGLLDWTTGLDYWTDIFLVFTHSEVGFIESC